MVKGLYLSLLIGPAVPVPAPKEVIDALTSIQVTNSTEGPSGFQLAFTLTNSSPLQTLFLLSGGTSIPPIIRVIIVVTVNGISKVLMDGVMTHHQITPGTESSYSTLTVIGEDLTKVMGYFDFSGIKYPATSPEGRVLLILAKYAALGIIPRVIPSPMVDIDLPTERIPAQKGNDLAYIRQLAEEVGYVFYIEPGPVPGVSTAYWGPEIKVGIPQPALSINMDAHTNVESINFSMDPENKRLPIIVIQRDPPQKSVNIPIPDITPFNPPLSLVPALPKGTVRISYAAKFSPIKAALIGIAEASKMSDVVSASGSLDVLRYGHVLKARKLVGVRGAGLTFDGLYYVKSVTHNIKRGEYKQSFTLSRGGLISTTQKVPV